MLYAAYKPAHAFKLCINKSVNTLIRLRKDYINKIQTLLTLPKGGVLVTIETGP